MHKSLLKGEGFVFRKRLLREQDEQIILFTRERGKIVVYAKGIKKITSKRLPHIQTGNYISYILNERNTSLYLTQSSLISAFQDIKKDPVKVNFLYQMLFILDKILPEDQPEEEVYELFTVFLIQLSKGDRVTQEDMTPFLTHILSLLGYADGTISPVDILSTTETIIDAKIPVHVII